MECKKQSLPVREAMDVVEEHWESFWLSSLESTVMTGKS